MPWTAEQAERWLGFLARHLHHDRGGTTDVAWWQLVQAVPVLIPWLLCMLVGTQAVTGLSLLELGLVAEGGGGIVVGLLVSAVLGTRPG